MKVRLQKQSVRLSSFIIPRFDSLLATLLALGTLLLYLRTLAPSVATLFDDSLEFPLVAQRLAIAHPTGYPLYTLLIAAAARLVPLGDVAYRVNLISALAGAGAVAMLFLAARQLSLNRPAALWAALVFATAETVWAEASIAEVYTLHLLILAALIWAGLRWGRECAGGESPLPVSQGDAQGAPLLAAFLFGLGLAHHRMMLLWAPALALFVALRAPHLRRPGAAWLRLGAAATAPLMLYLYLPLRAAVGSLDGSYENTLLGFVCWITACRYGAFLTGNPLGQTRDVAFYLDLLLRQFGALNLVLLAVGIAWLRLRPAALFLLAGGALSAAFALAYRVADPEVFWLPVVLAGALGAGAGLDGLVEVLRRRRVGSSPWCHWLAPALVFGLLLATSLPQWVARARTVDRSQDWHVHDMGVDVLSQPLPEQTRIIGILGEMTLLRYFQETAGLRLDIETVAADDEAARLAAVEAALAAGRRPFLTRPLPGAAERWSLGALGPLIEVRAAPLTAPPAALWPRRDDAGAGVRLVGWSLSPLPGHGPPRQRLTVAWQPTISLGASLKVSPRLVLPDGTELQGDDAVPVRFAYPTTAWRPGEVILDTYELPTVSGAAYRLILYREEDGREIGRVELPALQP